MLFTWFLGEPVIKALKTWNTLGERFLKENRIGILHDCGFDTGRLPMERIRVKSPDLFLAYIAAMALLWNVGLFVGRTGRLHRFDF